MMSMLSLLIAVVGVQAGEAEAPPQSPVAPQPAQRKRADITVTGRRDKVTRTIDGTTYDEHGNPQGQAGSAEDILRTVPTVAVSPDGRITVRGNGDVKVYINGRPSASTDAASLQAIPGSSVASVDLITNPSAKDDADGSIVVNINFKQGARDGFHSTASANAGSRGQANASVETSVGSGAFSARLSGSLRDNVPVMRKTSSTRLFDAQGVATDTFATTSVYDNDHRKSAKIDASADYDFDPDSAVGVDASYTHGRPLDIVREHHEDIDAAGQAAIYDRVRGGTYVQNGRDIATHYDRRGSKRRLSIKLQLEDSRKSTTSDRLFTTVAKGSSEPTTERVLNRSASSIRLASLDLGKSVRGIDLSGGAEWKRDGNRYINGRRSSSSAPPPIDFAAVQQTAAAYLSAQVRSGSWAIETGGRYERVAIDTALRPDGFRRKRTYSAFNDSVSLARTLGRDRLQVKASRAKQTISPGDLNPAAVYIDAQNLIIGNPDLSPQTVTGAEAEYDHRRGPIDGSLTLYYRHIDDTIDDFLVFRPDNVAVRTRENGGPSSSFGLTMSLSDTIVKSLKYSTTVNVFHSELSVLGQSPGSTEARFSYTLQGSLDWTISPADTLHLDGNVDGPTLVPQGTQTGGSSLDAVFTHTLSPKVTVSLTARGLVQEAHVRTRVASGRAINTVDALTSTRAVMVGLQYKPF